MVKQKQRNARHAPDKKRNQGLPKANQNPHDDGDWTIIKKQRITILIPPLPVKAQSTTIPNVPECHLQENPTKSNSEPSHQSLHETEKSMSLSPEKTIHPPKITHPSEPISIPQKPSTLLHRIASDNYPHSKGIGRKGMMVFADSSKFLNQRMRASYLEKKLKRAGGLENWLVSLGLTCFVNVFQRKRVNKFQLANLTMKKLKDMGADAVGPRRKLMHAIDCLCDPHCFQQHL
ncbi:hypothetical protein BUALT_Bualt09G0106900 [Buddleja alternifolia]|uniref:SAM domain-containing protein n=1 Tax=Buddleja alternifolia TaxID=168488 RepID=A0AAV6X8W9_9LAMI|nr:hypothetical protein BUALT_Bualt09G0106900 [Buddleja alternifolia]